MYDNTLLMPSYFKDATSMLMELWNVSGSLNSMATFGLISKKCINTIQECLLKGFQYGEYSFKDMLCIL